MLVEILQLAVRRKSAANPELTESSARENKRNEILVSGSNAKTERSVATALPPFGGGFPGSWRHPSGASCGHDKNNAHSSANKHKSI
jgi:hypothetical protein